jgi:hypothetical protein
MNDSASIQFSQSNTYVAQLKEQFERIRKIIEDGGTVQLELTEAGRSLSLTIDRNNVVKNDSPVHLESAQKTRSLTDNDGLLARSTNTFSFDVGDIDRQVKTEDLKAQFKKAATEKLDDSSKSKMRSLATDADVAPSSLPNPTVKYVGDTWVLAEDCVYTTNDGFTITAKNGFKTDLASVPRFLWLLVAPNELSLIAPIFHDLIYRSGGEVMLPTGEVRPASKIFTKQEADDLFLELMTRAKISYWKRNVAYLAVEKFGGDSWRKPPSGGAE